MSTNASGGRHDRQNRRPPARARSPRLNLDGLTILSARRLHLRLGRSWCTLTDEMRQETYHEKCREKGQETASPAVARKRGSRLNSDSRRRNGVTTARSFPRD